MLPSDIKQAQEVVDLLFALTHREGCSVQIISPNAEFDGPAACILVELEPWSDAQTRFTGDSVLDCLRKAFSAAVQVEGFNLADVCMEMVKAKG